MILVPTGLYVHIPFCLRRCDYCSFVTTAGAGLDQRRRYIEALELEMAFRGPAATRVDTVFFGGGTPSLLESELMERAVEAIRRYFPVQPGSEWTIEAHPSTFLENPAKLKFLRALGFNRLSLGVESGLDSTLARLNRGYDVRGLRGVIAIARDFGWTNINADLIMGWPWESVLDYQASLALVLELETDHLSVYPLSVESGTPFQVQGVRADADQQAELYLGTHRRLKDLGWDHYEIANFARPGARCRHNLKYWNYDDYFGLGVSAAGKTGNFAWVNARDIKSYMEVKGVKGGQEENLSDQEISRRRLILKLRLKEGILRGDIEGRIDAEALSDFEERGWLAYEAGYAALSPEGWLVSNRIFSQIN